MEKASEFVNSLSFALYKKALQLPKSSENVAISPLAILSAYMSLNDQETTDNEICLITHQIFQDTLAEAKNYFSELVTKIQVGVSGLAVPSDSLPADCPSTSGGPVTTDQKMVFYGHVVDEIKLTLMNTLFVRKDSDSGMSPRFNRSITDVVEIDAPPDDANEELMLINDTVERCTGKAFTAFPKGSCITPIFLNMLCFKAGWSEAFRGSKTGKREFFVTEQVTKEVDMMCLAGHFNFATNAELDADYLEICYASGEVSMMIVLPHQKGGLAEMESKIESANFAELAEAADRMHEVHLMLPRFFAESTIDFKALFNKFGLRLEAYESLQMLHQTTIGAHESGTGIRNTDEPVVRGSGTPGHPEPVEFVADHPFMFLVRHNATNCLLFIGKIEDFPFDAKMCETSS